MKFNWVKFNWVKVGDQDAQLRQICCLGPIMLEIVEAGFRNDQFLADGIVHRWNDVTKEYESEIVSENEVDFKEAANFMEDWYGLNILSEELFTGEG